MPGRTRSYTLQLPTFIRSQRNLAPESKKRHGDTKSNSATPMQTVCESGCLSLYPIADDESYSKGTIAFTFAQKEQLAPPRGNPIPWCVPKGSTTGIFRLGTSVATALLLAQTDFPSKSVRRKFLWVP